MNGTGVNELTNIKRANTPHNLLAVPSGSGSINGGWSILITKKINRAHTSQFSKP